MKMVDFNKSPYRERTKEMVDRIWEITEENFNRGPYEPARIGEALNALANCAACIIKNCDNEPMLSRFFYQAFSDAFKDQPAEEKE